MRRLGHHFSNFLALLTAAISKFSMSAAVKAALALMVLLAGLSSALGAAASATASTETEDPIPPDAIRIRILANSDSAFDQKVKGDVRDRVAAVIESWGAMPATHDEARALIASHLDEIQQTADQTLVDWGVSYRATTELAQVPFPGKTFEGREYAAGDYEALRISLGGGQGANWWCVLFPPLCLTAATKSEEQAPAQQTEAKADGKGSAKSSAGKIAKTSSLPSKSAAAADAEDGEDSEKPEARFFLWELLQKLGDFLGSIFS
ncbi:stage II sporulation protein R [Cohnella sp. CFH 77786]|uniref:stage II sporulation protein R n=1 Tax=Cohnella sp. CFH 77786 TaxID=2662265 RepID=UPI001C60B4EF|nr:stage II sporulation protein R [Cohnella sp. CFH 77786]MBW5445956.1 stage II sporulation protein R [Cohnella sp. CFH 77786]